MMTKTSSVALFVLVAVSFWCSTTYGTDYDEYIRLTDEAETTLDAYYSADSDEADAALDAAVDAALALIAWLDEFIASDDYAELSPEQQTAADSDCGVWEFNLSLLLIADQRCDEAHTRIERTLDTLVLGDDLTQQLQEADDEAIACLDEQTVELWIDCTPTDATVFIDGSTSGTASVSYFVGPGTHVVGLSAEGYQDHQVTVTVERGDGELTIGPVELEVLGGESPTWYEWTLWGVGTAGIVGGIAAYLDARDNEDELENPPDGMEPADPQSEQDNIDQLDTIAIVAGGLGLACVVTGTVLFLTQGDDGGTEVSFAPMTSQDGSGFLLSIAF